MAYHSHEACMPVMQEKTHSEHVGATGLELTSGADPFECHSPSLSCCGYPAGHADHSSSGYVSWSVPKPQSSKTLENVVWSEGHRFDDLGDLTRVTDRTDSSDIVLPKPQSSKTSFYECCLSDDQAFDDLREVAEVIEKNDSSDYIWAKQQKHTTFEDALRSQDYAFDYLLAKTGRPCYQTPFTVKTDEDWDRHWDEVDEYNRLWGRMSTDPVSQRTDEHPGASRAWTR
mmetsp:Transcript_137661/g.439807  ORF Transcript_137661/g.439807 Transcript_137661/m.439807 type:complete len:229 (-) Transcript_137661:135-821(-)|eukprot:CAMPEP_0203905174 /NCGR_PEP_ID=MMETSP0359-20131031/46903_1 /ASSEMBLY_ACC=CAM_ASM_000338 /TAXON_ID=268821 /ORGANISM="Scrippsiella Hangoei, Strain SHTV-5" /LENGTH=228 /DNA_ID=CAMNT_0050829567 /DNA_START=1 /DNA_END=687 /DNA_ORIENTATION=+